MSVAEFEDGIPWWESRMLLEQLEQDRPWIKRAYTVAVEEIEGQPVEHVAADPESLAKAGFNVG